MYIIQVMSWTLFEQWLDDHVVSCSRTVIGTNHEMDVAVSQLTGLGMPVKELRFPKLPKLFTWMKMRWPNCTRRWNIWYRALNLSNRTRFIKWLRFKRLTGIWLGCKISWQYLGINWFIIIMFTQGTSWVTSQSHGTIQQEWKIWPHGNCRILLLVSKSSKQMAHEELWLVENVSIVGWWCTANKVLSWSTVITRNVFGFSSASWDSALAR